MKRQCAICMDKCQTNVKKLWQRDSDQVIFTVCLACAEDGVVNASSVQMKQDGEYATYLK